ncbi:MAG TPA: hypothetical protein PLS00_12050, partial [Niabella sp.]|nr:hypothetical protein [Niabella sp.]
RYTSNENLKIKSPPKQSKDEMQVAGIFQSSIKKNLTDRVKGTTSIGDSSFTILKKSCRN